MKKRFLVCCLFTAGYVQAQQGNELLVYSMKGNVTVIENSKESKAKIGKVLKPGSTIKTDRLAKLTMVCKQGKPLSLTKEGVFPVTRWKDSCSTVNSSVTSKYFQYIWDQLYVRSDDYKKEHPNDDGAIVKTDAPVRGQEELEIHTDPQLETLDYAGGVFALSWSANTEYNGLYNFALYNSQTGKPVFRDSLAGTHIPLERLKKYLRVGSRYYWTVAAANAEVVNGGEINYRSSVTVSKKVLAFQKMVSVPEDPAAQCFRVGYLLEQDHFLADAYIYYQKAARTAPGVDFFREKMMDFKKRFRLFSK